MTRSVEAIVDEQARRWELGRRQRARETRRPVITVARQHGALGTDLARRLAEELKFDLFDREIIHRIAESSHLGERVVASLDEKNRELLIDWLAAAASRDYLSPVEYRYHLTRVIGAIAHQGGAVILGRGAHLILGPGEALRVLVVAPLDFRVRNVMEREALADREARRRILEVEADRRAFLIKHFHADFAVPADFDVLVNPAVLGIEGSVRVVLTALSALPVRSSTHPLYQAV